MLYSKCDRKSLENLVRKPDDLIHIFKNHFGCVMDNEHCLRLNFSPYIPVVIGSVALETKLKKSS